MTDETHEAQEQEPAEGTSAAHAARPDWLPSQFKDAQQMAEAYRHLQARHTQVSQAASRAGLALPPSGSPLEDSTPSEAADPLSNGQDASDGLTEASLGPLPQTTEGLKIHEPSQEDASWVQPYAEEVLQTGGLKDESYQALAKRGMPRQVVDAFIEGQQARAREAIGQVVAEAGGNKSYSSMVQWAASGGLSAPEIQAFNAQISGADPVSRMMAIRGLRARFEAQGAPARQGLVRGNRAAGPSVVKPFRSKAEFLAAIGDPEYKTDPAVRAEVAARVKASPGVV